MPTQNETQFQQIPPGPRGVSVHHTRWTATTNPEGHFGVAGHMDTYTLYGDEDETIVLGWFSVKNGENGADPYDFAVKAGFEGTRDEFYSNFAENAKNIEELREIIAQVEALYDMVESKGQDFTEELEGIIEAFNTSLENRIGVPGGNGVVRVNTRAELPVVGEPEQLYIVVMDETVAHNGPPGYFVSTLYHWTGYAYLPVTDAATANQLLAILDTLEGLQENKADRGDYDASIQALQEDVTQLQNDIQEKASLAQLTAVETAGALALQNALEALEVAIQAATNLALRKEVVEVHCFCDLPEEGEEEVIYVVTRDECHANTLSLYYWHEGEYRYMGGSSVAELEGRGAASELNASHVWNTTDSVILAGTPVMLSGTTVDNLPGVTPTVLSDEEVVPKYIGVVLNDIQPNSQGVAARNGVVQRFNTTPAGEMWTVGDALYFRGNGGGVLTNVEHSIELYKQPVGYVLHVSPTEGIVYLAQSPFGFAQSTGGGGGDGEPGKSAYEIAVEQGFTGTKAEWLASLKGSDGKTAYETAVDNGFVGDEAAWLASLAGKSAYQEAVQNGFQGTAAEWLASLVGTQGEPGAPGQDGKTAFEIAQDNGYGGTEQEWTNSMQNSGIVVSNPQSAPYTVQNSDIGKSIDTNSTVTLPAGLFPVGAVFSVTNTSESPIDLTADIGVGLAVTGLGIQPVVDIAPYSAATLRHVGGDVWQVVGKEFLEPEESLSPEEIKLAYEANPNTNAFTDDEKDKLANMAFMGEAPNDGHRYVRQNRQWMELAQERVFYDVTEYVRLQEQPAANVPFFVIHPRLSLSELMVSDCHVGVRDPLPAGTTITVTLQPSHGQWSATAILNENDTEAAFLSADSAGLDMSEHLELHITGIPPGGVAGLWFTLRFEVDPDMPTSFLGVPQPTPNETLILVGTYAEGETGPMVSFRGLTEHGYGVSALEGVSVAERRNVALARRGASVIATVDGDIYEINTVDYRTLRTHSVPGIYHRLITPGHAGDEILWVEDRADGSWLVRSEFATFQKLNELYLDTVVGQVYDLVLTANDRQVLVCGDTVKFYRTADMVEQPVSDLPAEPVYTGQPMADGTMMTMLTADDVYMYSMNSGARIYYDGDKPFNEVNLVATDSDVRYSELYPRMAVAGKDNFGNKVVTWIGDTRGMYETNYTIRVPETIVDLHFTDWNSDLLSYEETVFGRALLVVCDTCVYAFDARTGQQIQRIENRPDGFVKNTAGFLLFIRESYVWVQ